MGNNIDVLFTKMVTTLTFSKLKGGEVVGLAPSVVVHMSLLVSLSHFPIYQKIENNVIIV